MRRAFGIILTLILLGSIVVSGCIGPLRSGAYLNVEDVDVLQKSVSDDTITLEITPLITNNGNADAEDVKIQAKAVDQQTGLTMNKNEVEMGVIKKGTTDQESITLTVPNDKDYTIEIFIFEGDRVVVRGHGRVNLAPKLEELKPYGEPEFVTYRVEPKPAVPGFMGVSAIIGLVAVALYILRRRR